MVCNLFFFVSTVSYSYQFSLPLSCQNDRIWNRGKVKKVCIDRFVYHTLSIIIIVIIIIIIIVIIIIIIEILFYSSEDDSFGAFSILFFLLFRFVLIDLYIILCPLLLFLNNYFCNYYNYYGNIIVLFRRWFLWYFLNIIFLTC